MTPRETREAKAERLVRQGRVDVLRVTSEEQWETLVLGDSGQTYHVGRTPETRHCECAFGAERGCSHYDAAAAAVTGYLAAQAART